MAISRFGVAGGWQMNATGWPEPATADCYAVWSVLLPLLRPDGRELLLPDVTAVTTSRVAAMAERPSTGIELAMRGFPIEIRVPGSSLGTFEEAAACLNAKAQQPVRLERQFTLTRGYRILSAEEVAEYHRLTPPSCVVDPAHPWHPNRRLEKKYSGYAPLCHFSRVYFDRSESLGLVWVFESARGVFREEVYGFGRVGRRWELQPWARGSRVSMC